MSKRIALLLTMATATCMISCDSEDNSCIQSSCDGSVLNVCHDGQIVEHKTCPNGCDGSQCIESMPAPYEGQTKCEGNTPMKYAGGTWNPQTPCAANQLCLQGICYDQGTKTTDNCINDQVQCSKTGVPQKCINNSWVDQTACTTGFACIQGKCEQAGSYFCTEGKLKCNDQNTPVKCVSNEWIEQEACPENHGCLEGICVENPKCWNKHCKVDETCMNNVCVPSWELETPDGTKCDTNTWVDYCTNNNEAVSCAKTSGVYRIKCATGCVVADMTIANDNDPWFPAFCDTNKSQYCTEKDIYLESSYCFSEKDKLGTTYYESSYQCAPKIGGGYFALDYNDYFDATGCPEGCDADNEHCAECIDKCNGNILDFCGEKDRQQLDCAELEAVCKSFSSVKIADCYDSSDECTELNSTKSKCDTTGGKGSVITWTCLHAENDKTDKNYWVKTATKACPAACNTAKTDCDK